MTNRFIIPGPPVPKGRPRFTKQGRAYTPAKTKEYQRKVAACAKEAGCRMIASGPVAIRIVIWCAWPKSAWRVRRPRGIEFHTSKPDATNVVRCVEDGMTGVCFGDDSQVCEMTVTKRYIPQGEEPHVAVEYWVAR